MGHFETAISREKMLHKILILAVFSMTVSGTSQPEWQNLNCEAGHKYLFSDGARPWYSARDECELYGGWLLSIDSQKEQNCLVRYAHSSGLQAGWFWHDANDAADEGILVHATDNSDLTWVNHLFSCGGNEYMYLRGLDYYMLGLHGENNRATGAWCDTEATYGSAYFICEGLIL